MKALSLSISILVAIFSIILFREQVIELATVSLNAILEKFKSSDSSSTIVTTTTTTTSDSESGSPFYNPKEKLVATEMSIPRAIRKVFLAVEQAYVTP